MDTMSDNIKVVVKVRPLISREIEDKLQYQWRVNNNTLYQLDSNGRDLGQTFTFDKVYSEETKTADVYNDIAKPIVEAATAGFNGTIFAYGQTSSGKTYTMTGTEDAPGIIPLAVLDLFKKIENIPDRDFLVRVSYIEIYNETLKDLLDVKKEHIKIQETYEGNIKVDSEERVTASPEEVLEVMRKGNANRQTGATNMNVSSSRSHSIFQITIESREHVEGEDEAGCVNVSQLNLVDLAGSERSGQTGATGLRFKEGTHINRSLSALSRVIKQLSEDPNKYANYRDSKLTRILKNSLGGNAKTSIICAVTPAAAEETISTLQFATRAKCIKNKPEVNAVATDATMIQSLTKQLSKLQSQLEMKKNLEVLLENKKHVEQDLQNKIVNLQKLILNGFGQRHSIEHIGGRRKPQALRRITISTLHAIEEDPAPARPKFCTPILKYNPLAIPNPSEFVPIQSSNKLSSLPEEPLRLVTPPPNEKKVNFAGEVIEIDSDDDEVSTSQTCLSPYHKCYNASKTPPCVLRKNAKEAEKNYKDIVELTEREKIYYPEVVELMEKLELSRNMTAQLRDEVEVLKKNSKEKDFEMERLKIKNKKTEEQIEHAESELEKRRKEYDTKLTDCEVSYETLKKKAKLREEELLSLLEEQKHKKCEDIGKLPPRPLERDSIPFMDMSKDLSLVNSESESSIVTPSEDERVQMQDVIADLQAQLTEKNQTIIQLEANNISQKQTIDFLEQSSQELQGLIDSLKERLIYFENENSLLLSSVETLNSTIKSQKENLETAHVDIESYNDVIQELKIKLSEKENIVDMNINDSVLQNMIANEEKVIATNENMKNIIHSFKIALDKRNKEIKQLKSEMQNIKSDNKVSIEDLNIKENQIELLNKEIETYKEQVNENIAIINKLIREKNNLASIEQELTTKLSEIEGQNTELYELNKENTSRIENLKAINEELQHSLSVTTEKELEYVDTNAVSQKKIHEMSSKITQLEEDIKVKDNLLAKIGEESENNQEYLAQAKVAIEKIKSITSLLTGKVDEMPEIVDNFITLLKFLSDGLGTLEDIALDTVSQKCDILKENEHLNILVLDLNNKHEIELTELKQTIEHLKNNIKDYLTDNKNFKENNKKLLEEITLIQKQIFARNDDFKALEVELISFRDKDEKMRDELLLKENLISELKEKEIALNVEIKNLEAILENSSVTLEYESEELKQNLLKKEEILEKSYIRIDELESELKQKCTEISDIQQKLFDVTQIVSVKDQFIENVFSKIIKLANYYSVAINTLNEDVNDDSVETILLKLDKINSDIIANVNSVIAKNEESMNQILFKTKQQLKDVCDSNLALNTKVTEMEYENKALSNKLELVHKDTKTLNGNLEGSKDLLEQLKDELKIKAAEIEKMENKARAWKDQFINLDVLMKQQMQYLQAENEKLKSRALQLKNETQMQIDIFSKDINHTEGIGDKLFTKYIPEIKSDTISPPSLLTICCNKIVDVIEPKQTDCSTVATSSSETELSVGCTTTDKNSCVMCGQLSVELRISHEENSNLLKFLEQLEIENKELIKDQENVRQELLLLLEPAQELQKKISSHKTNLSILTATTYAENRSLKSQVKGLQHHHSRFHNVCQRDIPEFKRQLCELLTILNGESSEIQNVKIKRYSLPDVLASNSTVCNFKNESTLDGDLLMLDTNVTLTTTGDNTLVGYDQTCLDLTQIYNEVSCQTDISQTEPNIMDNHLEALNSDNHNMLQTLEVLREDNCKLKEQVNKLSTIKEFNIDAQISPVKISSSDINVLCSKCKSENQSASTSFDEDIERLRQELAEVQAEKHNIEQKYNNLILETPSTDALVRKLNAVDKEVEKLTTSLNNKNMAMKVLQEENDTLSTQVMDNISEVDDLKIQLDKLNVQNLELAKKIQKLECNESELLVCPQCKIKEELRHSIPNNNSAHTKLSRSFSDSDTSSRHNKICTLQSELYAGREDCKELTKDVATIKQHLDCNSMSMDLDESMDDSTVFSLAEDFTPASPQNAKCNMPDIQEERPLDMHTIDRNDCYNYFLEKTGVEKGNMHRDMKIIDIMKLFYDNLLAKHGNDVENLVNKLKVYEESQNKLQSRVDKMVSENFILTKDIKDKEENLSKVAKILSQIKENITKIKNEMPVTSNNEIVEVVNMLKANFLNILDTEFGLSSLNIFEHVFNKYHVVLSDIENQSFALQNKSLSLTAELNTVNDNLAQIKGQLSSKESEYNLLKIQKERIHEISNAVTLDIVKKENEMNQTIIQGCKQLVELNIIKTSEMNLNEPALKNVSKLFEFIIDQYKLQNSEQNRNEKEALALEVEKSRTILDEKEKELRELKTQIQTLKDINNNLTLDATDKGNQLQTLKILHDDLNKAFNREIQENTNNLNLIDKLTDEINVLKETISIKEKVNASLIEKDAKTTELLNNITYLKEENEKIKSVNQMITEEKESYAIDLEKSSETIRQNNADMEKMTTDILMLRESVKESTSVIECLKLEAQTLSKEIADLKVNYEDKVQECSRLTINIKTHEKTAEIQSRMIKRLQKFKDDEDNVTGIKQTKMDELTQKNAALQNECETLMNAVTSSQQEIARLKNDKETLEARVSELESSGHKPRPSLDAIAESSRRRRQSLHDSKRILDDLEERKNLEALFESRQKPDDLFMDVDGNESSGRSTPFGLGNTSKGRDSLLSRTDQSDKDEDHPSRPNSVLATRRRRQSIHDMHRGVVRPTPSPHDLSNQMVDELDRLHTSGNKSDTSTSQVTSTLRGNTLRPSLRDKLKSLNVPVISPAPIPFKPEHSNEYEMNHLRQLLSACQSELEDLKERYRELDEECEICAEYLKEKDERCLRLRKENVALQNQLAELNTNQQKSKQSVAHVAVNTDEDWANLHAVVVDRMSYDAEVEKNKKLTKTIEELRFKKLDLKNTIAKMQKALQRNTSKDNKELEATKEELRSCKEELQDLRARYKELDEECETCAQYLKEREEQCRRLREAKAALETKLHEVQEDAHALAHTQAARRKRQTVHDLNRHAAASDDMLSYQAERDDSSRSATDDTPQREVQRLKMTIEKLSHQKSALEQQLRTAPATAAPPVYVATGSAIVQNQQLTDVMKENQRLKKLNAKLVNICKKRGKGDANRENEDPQQKN